MDVRERNSVRIGGTGKDTMFFAHGFGCDQNMWRHLEPIYAERYRTVVFDRVGSGTSDLSAYDPAKYSSLQGYAAGDRELARVPEGAAHASRLLHVRRGRIHPACEERLQIPTARRLEGGSQVLAACATAAAFGHVAPQALPEDRISELASQLV
jgi:hypothetical protein